MRDEHFSARTLDVGHALDGRALEAAREALAVFGAVHLQRTGLGSLDAVHAAMSALGFAPHEQFSSGGRTSESWQRKWVEPGLRRMDFYPPDLYLLANNEVQYRRCSPRRVLFYCKRPATDGGRAFVHSAERVERALRASGAVGRALLERLDRCGMLIETGFLHRDHPEKQSNYFQSWQERFGTESADEALARARANAVEYDRCFFRDDEPAAHRTLMTSITIRAFWGDPQTGERFLRFPRVALDGPSARNGYRRFAFGDGEPLSAEQNELLRAVYFATREGTTLSAGDLILFDNLRFGHSRESFSGERELYVAMAGELHELPLLEPAGPSPSPLDALCFAGTSDEPSQRYAIAPSVVRRDDRRSTRTFDARGSLDDRTVAAILGEFEAHGAVHIRNTGVRVSEPGALDPEVLQRLGFGPEHSFAWGGMNSGRTARKALSRELRATDEYPAHLWLLPHNEVLYQRNLPARLLFFSAHACPTHRGGRTFVHEADELHRWLLDRGEPGRALLAALRAHGMLIEMGFVDERHPDKHKNYFRSWQDRFETRSMDEAIARCRASAHQFDECWWREEPTQSSDPVFTLMTRVWVPAFYVDPETGRESMLFPRIALDPPSIINGHRRYPLGDGRELTDREVDLLLRAFLATREGVHYESGDILLCDNIRYGHSREAFDPPRTLGVAMAGQVSTEHLLRRGAP
ncbi:MAG: TauD/TfdA family dioxygenase [Polyangiales bacterium]